MEEERAFRRVLEDLVSTALRAGGIKGFSVRELGSSRAEREEALQAKGQELKALVEQKDAALAELARKAEVRAAGLAVTWVEK